MSNLSSVTYAKYQVEILLAPENYSTDLVSQ